MPSLGMGLGLHMVRPPMGSLADKAGIVANWDVNNLVSSTVINDSSRKDNDATLYNLGGTADSGILSRQLDSGLLSLSNLLGAAGNFGTDSNADGLADGWIVYGSPSSFSLAGNTQSFVSNTATYEGLRYSLTLTAGHVYYLSCYGKGTDSACLNMSLRNSGGTSYNLFNLSFADTVGKLGSVHGTVLNSDSQIIIERNAGADANGTFSIWKVTLIDLTSIFGAGNEPSKTTLDRWIRMHYESGGEYIGSTPLTDSQVRWHAMFNGIDNLALLVNNNNSLDIKSPPLAVGATVFIPDSTDRGFVYFFGTKSSYPNVQYSIWIDDNGKLTPIFNGSTLISTNTVVNGQWRDIMWYWDIDGSVYVYLDGGLIHTGSLSSPIAYDGTDAVIGARYSSATTYDIFLQFRMANISVYGIPSRTTLQKVHDHRRTLASRYGITYAS